MKDIGILLIHGFGGNIEEIRPLKDYLKNNGFSTRATTLKGHTGLRKDFKGVTYQDWILSAEISLEELQKEHSEIIIIGFSMGGLIATNLAMKHRIKAVVTLNSPIYTWNTKKILTNLTTDLKKKEASYLKYYTHALVKYNFTALQNFIKLLHQTKPLFSQVNIPYFVAQAFNDDTVHYKSGLYIYNSCPHPKKELIIYPQSSHLICYSQDAPSLFKDVEEFILSLDA